MSYALYFYVVAVLFFCFFFIFKLAGVFKNQLFLLSAVNLCKQRPRSDPTECWPNLIQTVDTLIVSMK